jgi:predicted nuclease with TOPRIM domain
MPFTVSEFRDLIQLLEQQPAWRAELRRWVLTDELLALPQTVHELAEAQRRTEEQLGQLAVRMDELTQRIDQLAVRMDQLTVRMDELTQRIDQLAVRMDQLAVRMDELTQRVDQLAVRMDQLAVRMDELTQRVDQLAVRMDELTQRVGQLTEAQLRMGSDVERLKGSDLERRYRERGHAYFSRILRRTHVLSGDELVNLLDAAVTQGRLSEDEADEVIQADVVVRGRRRDDNTEVYLVVEVSWGVGLSDVQRAADRATLLARLGIPALPVVAGFWVTPEAEEPAHALRVWQVTDGRVTPPGNSASH